jgi:hypothetical protein
MKGIFINNFYSIPFRLEAAACTASLPGRVVIILLRALSVAQPVKG